MEELFIKVNIYKNQDFIASEPALKTLGFDQFGCQGVQEFEMNEGEVDALLGARSYAVADLPSELLDEVEQFAGESQKIVSYFFSELKGKDFLAYISRHYPELTCSLEKIPHQDWNETWKQHYQTININNDLSIIPIWERQTSDKTAVYIDPGQGFGTGNHETTFLCLELMANEVGPIRSCFDYGCGSGILGLAAAKLHSLDALYFYDIDDAALENCVANIEHNERVDAREIWVNTKILKKDKYDLVFANILEHILTKEAADISALVAPAGSLILSGILVEQAKTVAQFYKELGFQLIKQSNRGDWSALLFHKV